MPEMLAKIEAITAKVVAMESKVPADPKPNIVAKVVTTESWRNQLNAAKSFNA
jgi:hypothetical protein